MANGKYQPPEQSAFGQIFDTLFQSRFKIGERYALHMGVFQREGGIIAEWILALSPAISS